MRLDVYLANKCIAKSRSRAAALISSGYVTVNGRVIDKSSFDVSDNDEVVLNGEDHDFVGRGGVKLEAAIEAFDVDVNGLICADIGASTGGFTDCLLRHGAAHVYAVDAGHGQLDPALVNDKRVTNIEGCNARYMTAGTLGEKCQCAVSDLSFISQTLVIPAISGILVDGAVSITLVKPQFECGKSALSHNGIVRDKKKHIEAVRRVVSSAVLSGLAPQKIIKSPIYGGDGNTEFLLLSICGGIPSLTDDDIYASVYEKNEKNR